MAAFRKDQDLHLFLDRLGGFFASDKELQEENDSATECNERCQELLANPELREAYLNNPEHYKFSILIQTHIGIIRRIIFDYEILKRIWREAHPQ